MADRRFDIVVFGATGFTGALTAEYLARNAPAGTRWALAGRNASKLEQVRGRLAAIDPACADLPLLHADADDASSLRVVAEATKVVITTVGPYIRYGEPLVAACADAGTDYVDLTGEPEFVDRMWLRYHEQAERSGARLVHSCGFDSIPYDLGVQFTVEQLPEGVPISIDGFMRTKASFSGGTYQSAIEILGGLRSSAKLARERRRLEGDPAGPAGPRRRRQAACRRVRPRVGRPVPDIDPATVLRSARALDRYGPDFRYSHYVVVGPLPVLVGLGAVVGVAAAVAQIPPARDALLKLKSSGEGPSEEQRAKSWFSVRFAAHAGNGDGTDVRPRCAGATPATARRRRCSPSRRCASRTTISPRAGQLTPAVAMGAALRRRLVAAGIEFKVLDGI